MASTSDVPVDYRMATEGWYGVGYATGEILCAVERLLETVKPNQITHYP